MALNKPAGDVALLLGGVDKTCETDTRGQSSASWAGGCDAVEVPSYVQDIWMTFDGQRWAPWCIARPARRDSKNSYGRLVSPTQGPDRPG